jgi:hypothetical protein
MAGHAKLRVCWVKDQGGGRGGLESADPVRRPGGGAAVGDDGAGSARAGLTRCFPARPGRRRGYYIKAARRSLSSSSFGRCWLPRCRRGRACRRPTDVLYSVVLYSTEPGDAGGPPAGRMHHYVVEARFGLPAFMLLLKQLRLVFRHNQRGMVYARSFRQS